jgi:hypothetical protein
MKWVKETVGNMPGGHAQSLFGSASVSLDTPGILRKTRTYVLLLALRKNCDSEMGYFSQEGFGLEQQWIYWVETITPNPLGDEQFRLSDINKALNESGRIGWELVGVIQTKPLEILAFYKRRLKI